MIDSAKEGAGEAGIRKREEIEFEGKRKALHGYREEEKAVIERNGKNWTRKRERVAEEERDD